MHTVNILASVGTSAAVDPRFDDLYGELDRTNTVVFFHPRVSGLCSPLVNDYQLAAPLGPLFEDALVVSQMVRRQYNQMGLLFPDLAERPSDTVRRMWFDTLVHGSVPALQAAVASFGVDRLVTGSDFPVMEHHDGYKASIDYIRHAGLAEADVEQILYVNAPRLFGLL
jgi:aminocarboxymuconate-semialdehyde decarboxylase